MEVPPGWKDTLADDRFLVFDDPRDAIDGRMTVGVFSTEAVSLYIRTNTLESCIADSGVEVLTLLFKSRILHLFIVFLPNLSSMAPGAE